MQSLEDAKEGEGKIYSPQQFFTSIQIIPKAKYHPKLVLRSSPVGKIEDIDYNYVFLQGKRAQTYPSEMEFMGCTLLDYDSVRFEGKIIDKKD